MRTATLVEAHTSQGCRAIVLADAPPRKNGGAARDIESMSAPLGHVPKMTSGFFR